MYNRKDTIVNALDVRAEPAHFPEHIARQLLWSPTIGVDDKERCSILAGHAFRLAQRALDLGLAARSRLAAVDALAQALVAANYQPREIERPAPPADMPLFMEAAE